MRLSNLQIYILLSCYHEKGSLKREKLLKFYDRPAFAKSPTLQSYGDGAASAGRQKKKPKVKDRVNIITKSLERLIDKEFLIGCGVRTPHRWFIREIKLTPTGRRVARKLRGEQRQLPFKIKNKI